MVWVRVSNMTESDVFVPDELTLSPGELEELKRQRHIEKVKKIFNEVGREMIEENPPGSCDFPEKLMAPVGLTAVHKIKVK